MKIIDTTTYFEEDLMMKLRFNILDPYVDKFIASEATYSHSGNKKDIKFDKKKFPKFEEKIVHIVLDKEPENLIKKKTLSNIDLRLNSISRIKEQRNFIFEHLESYSPNDYIIHSDNDEIPDLKNFDLQKNQKNTLFLNKKCFIINLICLYLILIGLDQRRVN